MDSLLSSGCNQVSGKVLGAGRWGLSKDDDDDDEIANNYVNVDGNGVAVAVNGIHDADDFANLFFFLVSVIACFACFVFMKLFDSSLQ